MRCSVHSEKNAQVALHSVNNPPSYVEFHMRSPPKFQTQKHIQMLSCGEESYSSFSYVYDCKLWENEDLF